MALVDAVRAVVFFEAACVINELEWKPRHTRKCVDVEVLVEVEVVAAGVVVLVVVIVEVVGLPFLHM